MLHFFDPPRSQVLSRDDPAAFAPPPAFGPFRVLHQIGVGALGPVFRTYEPTRDRLVAVKVFRLDVTPEQARALADELAKAAEAGLFHPSIVEPVAAGLEGTVAYRAEEYVAAESLDIAMRHYAPAALDKVLPFITQLAGAIDFARAAGIGHGALHPRDVFVTPDEARATGFGVVEAIERVGLRAPVRRPYSAPERIAGETWGTPADVFALAAIAFELLTARRPSGIGDQIGPLAAGTVGGRTGSVHAVLARAMHEDPVRRYPTALAFAGALEAAAQAEEAEEYVDTDVEGTQSVVTGVPAAVPLDDAASVFPSEVGAESHASLVAADLDPEDVAAERDEDIAHWDLSREERVEQPPEDEAAEDVPEVRGVGVRDEAVVGDGDEEDVDAAADRLVFDSADLATVGPTLDHSFQDDFHEEPHPLGAGLDDTPELRPVSGHASGPIPLPVGWSGGSSGGKWPPAATPRLDADDRSVGRLLAEEPRVDRQRIYVLPVAMGVLFGLLIGFGGGYAVGSRDSTTERAAVRDTSDQAGETADQPRGAATTGREFSEHAVTPRETPPPAVTPEVPTDVPAEPARPRPAAPPAAPTTTGRIVVRSTPAGAAVTVNGDWRGRTPLTLDDLALGRYVVRIVSPGYEVAREELQLTAANANRDFSVKLTRQPAAPPPSRPAARQTTPPQQRPAPVTFTGSVYVDSRPRGARVFIDGKAYGVTPVRIPDVNIGSHVVRLELLNHRAWTSSTRITAGEETRVTGSLEPIR